MNNGDTEERTYENGKLHGIATFVSHMGDRYDQNGRDFGAQIRPHHDILSFMHREERCYVSGKLDGPAKYFYTSGAVETRIYEKGILQGTV